MLGRTVEPCEGTLPGFGGVGLVVALAGAPVIALLDHKAGVVEAN